MRGATDIMDTTVSVAYRGVDEDHRVRQESESVAVLLRHSRRR